MLKITIITLGNKMPAWVNEGVAEFSKRLQDGVNLTLIEIPLQKRGKGSDLGKILEKEKETILTLIPAHARLIALDVTGDQFNSEQLASKLTNLSQITSHLCFFIGGPEGLHSEVVKRCHERWSLSKLTLPHTLARIVLLEALYRAWSINHHHPYHK